MLNVNSKINLNHETEEVKSKFTHLRKRFRTTIRKIMKKTQKERENFTEITKFNVKDDQKDEAIKSRAKAGSNESYSLNESSLPIDTCCCTCDLYTRQHGIDDEFNPKNRISFFRKDLSLSAGTLDLEESSLQMDTCCCTCDPYTRQYGIDDEFNPRNRRTSHQYDFSGGGTISSSEAFPQTYSMSNSQQHPSLNERAPGATFTGPPPRNGTFTFERSASPPPDYFGEYQYFPLVSTPNSQSIPGPNFIPRSISYAFSNLPSLDGTFNVEETESSQRHPSMGGTFNMNRPALDGTFDVNETGSSPHHPSMGGTFNMSRPAPDRTFIASPSRDGTFTFERSASPLPDYFGEYQYFPVVSTPKRHSMSGPNFTPRSISIKSSDLEDTSLMDVCSIQ